MSTKDRRDSAQGIVTESTATAEGKRHQPVDDQQLFLLGVGASAGGLEALLSFFSEFKGHDRMSFVVVQHMSPQHPSMLADLLARDSDIEITEVKDGDVPRPNTVHVTPPNANIVLHQGSLFIRSCKSATFI